MPPYKRPVNTVFQKYALFPHLNVFENVAFGLRLKKMTEDEIRPKVSGPEDDRPAAAPGRLLLRFFIINLYVSLKFADRFLSPHR